MDKDIMERDAASKIGPEGGAYVKKARMDAFRMTQDAFAELLGVSVSTLRAWEGGTNAVPAYVLRAVRVMSADPARAMMELGCGICLDEDDRTGWEFGGPVTKREREDAVEWMKASPDRVKVMDCIDGLQEFMRHYKALGGPALATRDLLLLLLYAKMETVAERLDEAKQEQDVARREGRL